MTRRCKIIPNYVTSAQTVKKFIALHRIQNFFASPKRSEGHCGPSSLLFFAHRSFFWDELTWKWKRPFTCTYYHLFSRAEHCSNGIGAQILSVRSPWRLNFVRWRLIGGCRKSESCYNFHNNPTPYPIQSQIIPVHTVISCSFSLF